MLVHRFFSDFLKKSCWCTVGADEINFLKLIAENQHIKYSVVLLVRWCKNHTENF
jgi:hypothetical protein